jgi:hypothetical protein
MAIKNKFTPIQIYANDPSEIFETHREQISKAIVHAIQFGIGSRRKRVDFAQVLIKEIIVITLSIDKREFKDLLEEQLETLIQFEDYETCALAVKLKDKLNKKKL